MFSKLASQAGLCYNEALKYGVVWDVGSITRPRYNVGGCTMSDIIPQDDIPLKRCSNPECHKWFPATPEFFHRHKGMKDGLQLQCKECRSKRAKRDNARPEVRARNQAQKQAYDSQPENRERKKARESTRQKERRNNPETRESVLAHDKEYRSRPDVREKRRANWKAWHSCPENKERVRTQRKKRRSRHEVRERRREQQHSREARKKAVAGTHTATQIQELLKRQQYRCYYAACGHARFEKINGKYIYHVDHTFPLNRVAGSDVPANDISYLVLACPTCNQRKGDKYPWEWAEGGKLL